jgi:hypothetical protein
MMRAMAVAIVARRSQRLASTGCLRAIGDYTLREHDKNRQDLLFEILLSFPRSPFRGDDPGLDGS